MKKTLDEVIAEVQTIVDRYELDGCFYCSFLRECKGDGECYFSDTLHYLQEYRDHQQRLLTLCDNYGDAIVECERVENKYKRMMEDPDGDHQQLQKARALLQEFYRNDPLDWDELKQMEGKPVWICMNNGFCHWGIIDDVYEDEIYIDGEDYTKKNMVTVWQAYRKERDV